jgi:hypothetical protein
VESYIPALRSKLQNGMSKPSFVEYFYDTIKSRRMQ